MDRLFTELSFPCVLCGIASTIVASNRPSAMDGPARHASDRVAHTRRFAPYKVLDAKTFRLFY